MESQQGTARCVCELGPEPHLPSVPETKVGTFFLALGSRAWQGGSGQGRRVDLSIEDSLFGEISLGTREAFNLV